MTGVLATSVVRKRLFGYSFSAKGLLDTLNQRMSQHKTRFNPNIPAKGRASVLVPIIPVSSPTDSDAIHDLIVLMCVRCESMRLHPGEVCFPGGKQDPEDLSPLDCAVREAKEEIGLTSKDFKLMGQLDEILSRTMYLVSPFVVLMPNNYDVKKMKLSHQEVDRVIEVPLSEVIPNIGSMEKNLKLEIQGEHIWGMSFHILYRLLDVGFGLGNSLSALQYVEVGPESTADFDESARASHQAFHRDESHVYRGLSYQSRSGMLFPDISWMHLAQCVTEDELQHGRSGIHLRWHHHHNPETELSSRRLAEEWDDCGVSDAPVENSSTRILKMMAGSKKNNQTRSCFFPRQTLQLAGNSQHCHRQQLASLPQRKIISQHGSSYW
eukprot:TRINITY_DN38660_c0_g1_i1.p1 TRINITY_DN38660_c0_g1~~TRINITY_DN38660_c0_g1_i1.p1  ORF type:complete len:440 (+),score=89.62 TRINITY_DN38660_c0_g1_i1:179-1321(+)